MPPRYSEPTFSLVSNGNYRARISNIIWDTSKNNNEMLVITFKISGQKSTVKHWIVFKNDSPEAINRSNFFFKRFCDAFNLNPNSINIPNFNLNTWNNAEGGVSIEQQTSDNGVTFARVKNFLTRKQLAYLPPFLDASAPQAAPSSGSGQAQTLQPATQGTNNPVIQQAAQELNNNFSPFAPDEGAEQWTGI